VLTGFKYISELIEKWEKEEKGGMDFLLGFEESLGYLSSKNIRDKDATLAACQICEIALHLKQKGKSLKDYLYSIYEKYGVYREGGISIVFKEKHYADDAFVKFMQNIPKSFFNQQVIKIDNYKTSTSTNLKTNQTSKIDLPVSNVLTFHMENGDRYIIRPSGTEPKIKIYASFGEKRNKDLLIDDQLKNLDAKIKANLSFFFRIFNP
jgi:phosphoglucomutase